MCGRYVLGKVTGLNTRFDLQLPFEELSETRDIERPRFNIAPSQQVLAVVDSGAGRMLRSLRWGFQPGWYSPKAGSPPPINARAETVLERPMFRGAVQHNRCLIPADGFYEWRAASERRTKQPQFIHRRDGDLFAFAGIYTPDTNTCAIITTTPNAVMEPIHNRMPVILTLEHEHIWLESRGADPAELMACLQPYPAMDLEAYPVSPGVNSPRHDAPELIARQG